MFVLQCILKMMERHAMCNIHERSMHIKRSEMYKICFRVLGVPETADQDTVRRAYITLVKKVHPDSGHAEASTERFKIVDEAFKLLQEKFAKNRRGIYPDEEEKVFDIRHTAPQHRQYLSFDGQGIGNPSQREKQYQQIKVVTARQRVLNHEIEKSKAGENTLMKKGTFFEKHNTKTKYGYERVVEDLIQEAMLKGDFDNLKGTGKPLPYEQNPFLDSTTYKLNKILNEGGFKPEWIVLQQDIKDSIKKLKYDIEVKRSNFGDYPFDEQTNAKWNVELAKFEDEVKKINKCIDKFNLIAPFISIHFFRLKLNTLAEKILSDPSVPKKVKDVSTLKSPSLNKYNVDFFSSLFSIFASKT
ncbi:dnaJ homolog subfamily C member 28 [Teleopsis dalmanni]|uniref:dnaJ homolog subfamily C member 28 n=1 Tax=Teleopsis dalmanni TaxID=139649 RepID=UPI0018CE151C|nr:dnaJ homolog subfamily C member 28 [Teleopsis dalmanni]